MNHENKVRLFIAIELPEHVLIKLHEIQQHFKTLELFHGSYPKAKQSHITIKFLGTIDQIVVPEIIHALKTVKCNPFTVQLNNLADFKNKGHIKVVYIALKSAELASLAQACDLVLSPWADPARDTFIGHITVARVRSIMHQERLENEIAHFQVPNLSFIVNSYSLKQSILTQDGPLYTDLMHFPL